MMFREIIGVYFENRINVIIKFSGQNWEFLNDSSVAHVANTGLSKVNKIILFS